MAKTFYPTVRDGVLALPKPQEESRKSYLRSLEGKPLVENLKLWRPRKSHNQVKAIFGLALRTVKAEFDDRGWDTSMLFQCPNPTGIGVTVDLLRMYFYSVCPMFDDHGDAITLSSESCTTEKAAKFLTDIQAWAVSQWSIYIPDPDPTWNSPRQKE